MTAPILFSSATDEWATPRDFFAKLNRRYRFTLDPCATAENATCPLYFTRADDGLKQDWGTHRVFCNTPYGGQIGAWASKCFEASRAGPKVVLLVPARTDARWFHEWIQEKADAFYFVRGRLRFGQARHSAPFPSMVVLYGWGSKIRLAQCARCGQPFDAKRRDAKACSNACRQALHRNTSTALDVTHVVTRPLKNTGESKARVDTPAVENIGDSLISLVALLFGQPFAIVP